MQVIFAAIEEFAKAHQYTIAALGVLATFSAVVVSLAIAFVTLRSNRTQLKAFASISVILHSTLDGKPKPTYVTVYIRNIGILPVMIPFQFFQWHVPFSREGWIPNPWDYVQGDEWIPQRRYPFEVKPRASETFYIGEIEVFRDEMRKIFKDANIWNRFIFRYLKARVITEDGKMFHVQLSDSLRKEIRTLRQSV